ncbi:MAG: class I SAM-dependent methyltransferase [Brevundimonas sp.]|uniref:class I SAM-dependent methyltransferase n=1 Tax=Brevundimonas sp. TaxID=1871086 RepID=UPI00391C8F72
MSIDDLNVQYGAGWDAAPGWINFDSSPSLWLERLPLIGGLLKMNAERFPAGIRFGDITRGLPVPNASAKAVYASHVLEHLSYADALKAVRNTRDLLKTGGVFRVIVPDLKVRVDRYMAASDSGDPEAASRLMRETLLGRESRATTPIGYLRALIGNSEHLWMWDEASLRRVLEEAGFVEIRRCDLGDAEDPDFRVVERADRFRDEGLDVRELAMEARRP